MTFNKTVDLILEDLQTILNERVYGNAAFVYSRTRTNPEGSTLITKGIQPSQNAIATYGTGLYCCYDINSQLRSEMKKKYGPFLMKGKVDLTNFVILDEEVYNSAMQSHIGNFDQVSYSDHLKRVGTSLEYIKQNLPFTSVIAYEIWNECKSRGYNGIVFTGENDGKVAVVWNRHNFIPWSYTEDDGKTWKKLNPNIASIKRKEDPEYDKDPEKVKFNPKSIENLESIKNLEIPISFNRPVHLPNLKRIEGELTAKAVTELSLPNLEYAERINAWSVLKFHAPKLTECSSLSLPSVESLDLPSLKLIDSGIWCESAKAVNLPAMKLVKNKYTKQIPILHFRKAEYINLSKLNMLPNFIGGENAKGFLSAKKIIVPRELAKLSWPRELGSQIKKIVPANCEIVYSNSMIY